MIELMDPYEWLPPYGENDVALRTERLLLLVVTVSYDNVADERAEQCRDIVFDGVTEFMKRPFPGLLPEDGESSEDRAKRRTVRPERTESSWKVGTLGMDETSSRANAWETHFRNTRSVNRYVLHFLSENIELEVFASSFHLGEARLRAA